MDHFVLFQAFLCHCRINLCEPSTRSLSEIYLDVDIIVDCWFFDSHLFLNEVTSKLCREPFFVTFTFDFL